ncbi:MAG: hypothetical protein KBT03_03805 [Bacteroidales bacterium]|nr:hypothetical protein [Candidatus Scybalousia scybalohippi]
MINVSNAAKDFYISENPERELIVTIGSGDSAFTLTSKQIIKESMELKEAISESDSLEFVGCIASQFTLQIVGVKQKLKNKEISVSMRSQVGEIPLFNGTINSDERTANRRLKEIKAYDALYNVSDTDVTNYVNSYHWPVKFKKFRNDFFDHIGITQKVQNLSSDDITIYGPELPLITEEPEQYLPENKTLTALDVMKAICQFEGVFGIINRYNKFEYRKLAKYSDDDGAYPGAELIPPFVPGIGGVDVVADAQFFPSYRSLSMETYNVNNIKTVVVKQNDDSKTKGVKDEGGNKYIVLGNLFTMYGDKTFLNSVANNIYKNINDIDFTPFNAECIGIPYLEVGDAVEFYVYDFEASEKQKTDVYVIQTFFVLSRTLTGIMSTKDVLSASAEKRKKRISDLGIRISLEAKTEKLEKEVKDVKDQTSGFDERIENLEDNSLKCYSVQTEPTNWMPNSIYLIQGTVN